MNREQMLDMLGNDNPVLCGDGKLGMLVAYIAQPGNTLCGVQVPGEDAHRWIDVSDLTASEHGALRQAGAPKMPPACAQHDMAQLLLAMDWAQRGGPLMAG